MNVRYRDGGEDLQKRLLVIDADGTPIDYLAFNPEDFNVLNDWQILMSTQKHGIAYRLGVKEGVYDSAGEPISLYLFYSHHLVMRGETLSEGEKQALDVFVRHQADTATRMVSRMTGADIKCMVIDPMPHWLQEDLEELLVRTIVMYEE